MTDHSENSPPKKVKVLFYSGRKGEETPRAVLIEDREYRIEKVISTERIFDVKTRKVSETFTCRTEGKLIQLRRIEGKEWTAALLEKS
ncbi:MAG: hypothetical protein WCC06_11080 [Candidatus Aminicenantales bacterium]